jgi:hypothetical protein
MEHKNSLPFLVMCIFRHCSQMFPDTLFGRKIEQLVGMTPVR